jgi:tetratricopeptide (TPR) repeat protein
MKLNNNKYISLCLSALLLMQAAACKKDYTDPSKVPNQAALTTARGLAGVATGLQKVYSTTRAGSIYNAVTLDGFVTRQLNILNQGNTAEYQLYQGDKAIDNTNTILGGLWINSNKVIFDANNILNNAPALGDKNFASGLIAYASIFKALALGNLASFWDHVPDTTGTHVGFKTSDEGFAKAIDVINNALAVISKDTISASFLGNIPAGIDIINTLHALKARYSLYIGNYPQALAEANAVDLSKKSVFNFDAVTLNPIYETATSTNNVYQPIDSTMGLPQPLEPSLTDKREPFYIAINTATAPRYRLNGFYAGAATSIPVYLPGEMILTKAEVYARQLDLPDAIIQLNKILTKKPSDDPYGVGADQPAYAGAVTQAALLDQIYRNRCIELYLSGLKLPDMRRFARPTSERKRNFLPYPFAEKDNNPNTPDDPLF